MHIRIYYFLFISSILLSCSTTRSTTDSRLANIPGKAIVSTVVLKEEVAAKKIDTKKVAASDVVRFAETLQGIPYKYGSAVKENGFDCSGFVTYVFRNFKISVPRVSKDFTNAGKPVSTIESLPGDIILFTGSDVNSGVVGHMGIITENKNGVLRFIHSASGNNGGVMISGLNSYFLPRFVKVIRIFPSGK